MKRTRSQQQEKQTAERFGGRVTPGSGNGWLRKNDVRSDTVSFEMKYTDAQQFTLKIADLEQAEGHAIRDGREMVFGVSFAGDNYVIISEDYYAQLVGVV
jgi:hypothetical protein